VPARCTTLYSIEVPKVGGDTLFANQYAAYDGLSATLKKQIENLVALHHYGNRDDQDKSSRTVASVLSEDQEKKMAWVRHPVARKHPVTGAPLSMPFRAAPSASRECPRTRRSISSTS